MIPVRTAAPRRPWSGRLVVLVGIVLVALNLRIAVASVSPILDAVSDDVAFTATQAGLLGTVPVVSFAFFGAVAPTVGRRLGLEPSLVLAMLLSAVGEVVRSTTTTSFGFIGWSVIALAGMGMGNVLLPPLVKRYFPDRIGAVTAVYSVAMSVSTAVPPLLAAPVAARVGWRVSIGWWAVVGVVAVVPWLFVIVRSAHARTRLAQILRRAPRPGGGDVDGLAPAGPAEGRLWRTPLAWGMALTFAMNTTNAYVVLAWLPQILGDAGIGAEAAGRWLALFAILGLPPALAAPLLAERIRNPWFVVLFFVACLAAGYAGLMVAPAGPTWLWILLIGLGPGTFPLLLTLINLRTRTSGGASRLSGFTQGVGYGLAGAGPLLVGVLRDVTGSWTAVYVLLFTSLGVLLAAAAVACRPVMLEDVWDSGRT